MGGGHARGCALITQVILMPDPPRRPRPWPAAISFPASLFGGEFFADGTKHNQRCTCQAQQKRESVGQTICEVEAEPESKPGCSLCALLTKL